MIEVTVKTLDSQNHPFTVEDDITVKEFKDLISGKVNIPAETQRIIYCGRVLQDAKKLNEYDVNGKVVHLVQRAPPQSHRPSSGSGNSNTSRFQIPSPNQIYLGSMAYSADMMDAQQRIPQLPLNQNLSNSRLNVARKMLRLASAIINQLENQTTENATNSNGTENNMDSLLLEDPIDTTPVLAAQVYVPAFGNVFDQQQQITSAVLSATDNFRNIVSNNQNNNVAQQTDNTTAEASTETGNTEEGATSLPPNSAEATNEAQSGNDATTENNASQNTNNGTNIARTTSLADLMDELNRIQTRLQPFMIRYNELMRTDPTFESDAEMQEAQRVFDRVSATMHALGHAYHALSDVICPFNRPTPRALLCRPTLVQHAVLQAGISLPVRVQAQVDVENITGRNPFGRPDGNSDEGSDESDNATNTESNQNIQQEETTNEETSESTLETGTTTESAAQPSAPSNNSSGASQTQETNAPTTTTSGSLRPQVTVTHRPGGARNVDIIVAMSPDDDPITQGLGGPNQDLIQSLVHAVTNSVMRSVSLTGVPVSMSTSSVSIPIGTNGAPFISTTRQPPSFGSTNTNNANATSTNTTSATTNASNITTETTTAANGLGGAGQNSQARGNTATLPTTSTQTPRSTPRPHVQLSPHSFRAFDPFLQCNSHHITGQNRNANRTGNGARSQTVREESPFEIVSVQSIPSRARSTSLPRELNRMHGGRTARSNTTAASATATSASSSTPVTTTRKNATNTEATQTSTSTLPSDSILTLPTPINMEVDTFYDATEHEDGNDNSDSGRTKQKVLLPTSNGGESSSPTLPDVNIGTESWHNNVPSDWVSVVTRDCQVQRHETAQPPYSDAYLSSVPAKRRKVISCNKPQGTLPQVITESLRQAVLTTGLSQVAPIDNVVGAAGGDTTLQAAYREELRQSIRSRPSHATPPGIAPLKRFPNASICFQKP